MAEARGYTNIPVTRTVTYWYIGITHDTDTLDGIILVVRASESGTCHLAIVVQNIFFRVIASRLGTPVLPQGRVSQRVCDVLRRSKDA